MEAQNLNESPSRRGSHPLALASLLAANLMPIAGYYFLHWEPGSIMFSYWLENVVIGLFTILKILKAQGPTQPRDGTFMIGNKTIDSNQVSPKVFAKFFLLHFGGFTFGHGMFTLILFGAPTSFTAVLIMFATFMASHWISYQNNYLENKEYLRVSPARVMMSPYGRVILMHIAIIGSGFWFVYNKTPLATGGLFILVGLKTTGDLLGHFFEHWKRNQGGAQKIEALNKKIEESHLNEKIQEIATQAQSKLPQIRAFAENIAPTIKTADGEVYVTNPGATTLFKKYLRRGLVLILFFVLIGLTLAFLPLFFHP